jgi:hypothetical protein
MFLPVKKRQKKEKPRKKFDLFFFKIQNLIKIKKILLLLFLYQNILAQNRKEQNEIAFSFYP